MKTLLIIDDEPTVIQGLVHDISWEELGFGDVLSAGNGSQALEILRNKRVDIVISDIRMPELDGLQLAKQVYQNWPFARLIILSGYDLFSYAQEAMKYHVFRYLTKPTPYPILVECVAAALNDQKSQTDRMEHAENLMERLARLIPLVTRNMLQKIIVDGEDLTASEWGELREYIPFADNNTAVLQVFLRSGKQQVPDIEWLREQAFVQTQTKEFEMLYIPLLMEGSLLLVSVWEDTLTAGMLLDHWQKMADLLFPVDEHSCTVQVVFSPVHLLSESGDTYVKLIEICRKKSSGKQEQVVLSGAWDRMDLRPHQMVIEAKKIIEHNLEQDFSISELAEKLHLHPGYISSLFRDSESVSLQQYIIRRKIEHAADLLREPGARVFEVAQRIGYSSPYHFSRIFKKIKSVSPKDYQRGAAG
jgi:two-component system, response regulator YesN